MAETMDYSKLADSYDEMSAQHAAKVQGWMEAQDFYGICSVLDYGAGTGNLAGFLSKKPGCGVDAVDTSKEMVDKVKAKFPSVNAFVCGPDGKSDQYKDMYDLVVASMVLHHVDDSSVLQFLSDKARQHFCLIEFDADIEQHAKQLEGLGWKLEACGKFEFDMLPDYYRLLEQVNMEGVDHEDMPDYHKRLGEHIAGHEENMEGPWKVTMNWYGKGQ